jgi:hypothetical protein
VAATPRGNDARVTTVKQVEARLGELEAAHAELVGLCRRLAAHAEVVGVAVRSREAVSAEDLDEAVEGLHALYAELAGASRAD